MRATYRVTPLLAWIFSIVVLAGSGVLLGLGVRDTVQHLTADDQPATVTEVGGTSSRTSTNDRRRSRSISFRLEDGSEHAAAADSRWFWWPSEGDTIHVHETAPDDWTISEEFSWVRTIGYGVLLLLPWLFALLKAWEWAEKTWRPEQYAAKQRDARQKTRERRLARRRSST